MTPEEQKREIERTMEKGLAVSVNKLVYLYGKQRGSSFVWMVVFGFLALVCLVGGSYFMVLWNTAFFAWSLHDYRSAEKKVNAIYNGEFDPDKFGIPPINPPKE